MDSEGIHRESPWCAPRTLLIQCRLHKTKKHTVIPPTATRSPKTNFIESDSESSLRLSITAGHWHGIKPDRDSGPGSE